MSIRYENNDKTLLEETLPIKVNAQNNLNTVETPQKLAVLQQGKRVLYFFCGILLGVGVTVFWKWKKSSA